MSESIVVGYHGTEACKTALRLSSALAERMGGTLHIVSVEPVWIPGGGFGWSAPYENLDPMREVAKAHAGDALAQMPPGMEVSTHVHVGAPAAEIARLAGELPAALVVVGAVRHGTLSRIFLGSTADRLARVCPAPCLFAVSDSPPERILVGADDSACSRRAIRAACRLASRVGAKLRAVHVVGAPPHRKVAAGKVDLDQYVRELEGHFEEYVDEVKEEAGALEQSPAEIDSVLRVGDPAAEILHEIESSKSDLVVVGRHGKGFFERAVLGSVSETVLRRSSVSVLVVPGKGG